MKLIQICGTNGTGKTTLVKGLLASGRFMKMECIVDGAAKEWWFDGETAVIGKYGAFNCGGVDAGRYSGDALPHVIQAIMRQYKPQTVLFEDVRYGGSYTFKTRLTKLALENGYEYVSLVLIASLECTCNRVLTRSNKIDADYDRMRSKARQVIRSSQKLQRDGVDVVWIDTEHTEPKRVLHTLMGVINDR